MQARITTAVDTAILEVLGLLASTQPYPGACTHNEFDKPLALMFETACRSRLVDSRTLATTGPYLNSYTLF